MDFVQALVSLGRNSPALVPEDCGGRGNQTPYCGALLSGGLTPSASVEELKTALEKAFGATFLGDHRLNPKWSAEEQRVHVKALLGALKKGYTFYKQSCLAHAPSSRGCDRSAPSFMLGRIACAPEEDNDATHCVYAELRQCSQAACQAAGDATGFFEYSRMHGPLALFETRVKRDRVMGQCEEFSRAAYALLSSLGYEARYVLDFTDHVWVEIKLPPLNSTGAADSERIWVHADPSEGILDAPLMYEEGWGKKLTMIFAFTPWAVEHVTARYTNNYAATVARRGSISEDTLGHILAESNRRLKYELPLHSWGYGASAAAIRSKDRSFEDLALWSHFEAR